MVSGETVCVCDVVTWCDREGSRGKGNSGKKMEKGKMEKGVLWNGRGGTSGGGKGKPNGSRCGNLAREFANMRALAGGDNGWGALS